MARLTHRLDRLIESVLTLAAAEISMSERLPPDQAALRIAEQHHEIRHALATWRRPDDSYRSQDLGR
jgi:hypothetical protein